MAPGAAHPALLALLALLGALLPGPGGAETSVQPPKAIIPQGGSVRVTCSASCDHPSILGLETELTKKEVDHGENWKTFELTNVLSDSTPKCFSTCSENQSSTSVSIIVYRFPEHVKLAPLPTWQPVDEHFILTCQVSGGAPRAHLSVMLLRGEEVLERQPVAKGESTEVMFTVLAKREDHGVNFSCRTELDLRSEGLGLFQNSSAPRKLQTFVLPMTGLHLDTLRIVEVGTQWLVSCTLDGLFPASEAEVHMALGDQNLEPKIVNHGDSLLATAWVKSNEEEGTQHLVCQVTLGDQTRSRLENVTIYSFPAPYLTLSRPQVPEWTTVTVECKAHAGAVVTLEDAPARLGAPRAQLQLNASAEDNGRSFSCSAALEVAGQWLYKNRTLKLSVLYGPRLDERDCPGNWTWQEGSQQTLRCQARGNPLPKLKCSRKGDGASLPIGDLRPVKREVAGTYLCQANSSRGVTKREVVVNVIYHQNIPAIIVPVVAVITLGAVGAAAYIYYRKQKKQIYELQKAQKGWEKSGKKLNTPATPP
ncbi:intercellular adhesion molecule 1 isoform X1 [Camelus ferus]|uniref:Intercellular adhesion molecule 1 n=2 Tax=Camelus TaxID=9836 RepID=A0A8B6YAM7_CAMFR|nr:intercellular adhesion molecule 1 isoform X1 [Camelus ferus]XP_010952539.1 intercellular adhesion molecule 1 [Camelus bactrianus]